jgi:hypothetical protein
VADKAHWIHKRGVVPVLIGVHIIYTMPTCILLVLIGDENGEAVRQDMMEVCLNVQNSKSSIYFYLFRTIRHFISFLNIILVSSFRGKCRQFWLV